MIKVSNSWGEIAGYIGVAPEVLEATIEEYNSFCEIGYDKVFSKDCQYPVALRNPPYYDIK